MRSAQQGHRGHRSRVGGHRPVDSLDQMMTKIIRKATLPSFNLGDGFFEVGGQSLLGQLLAQFPPH